MLDKVKKNSRGIDKLVFMGDYVDRGMYGPEVVAYICAMKIANPNNVIMLRGNHETRQCAEDFNFRAQTIQHYDLDVFNEFMDLFDNLPVAAQVNGSYLAVHGGITRELHSLDQINDFERRQEPSEGTLLSDMIWADPLPDKIGQNTDFLDNRQRGTSCLYGRRPVTKLLK